MEQTLYKAGNTKITTESVRHRDTTVPIADILAVELRKGEAPWQRQVGWSIAATGAFLAPILAYTSSSCLAVACVMVPVWSAAASILMAAPHFAVIVLQTKGGEEALMRTVEWDFARRVHRAIQEALDPRS